MIKKKKKKDKRVKKLKENNKKGKMKIEKVTWILKNLIVSWVNKKCNKKINIISYETNSLLNLML